MNVNVVKSIILCFVCVFSTEQINANDGAADNLSNSDLTADEELSKHKELAGMFEILVKEYNDIDIELAKLATDYISIIRREDVLKKRRIVLINSIHVLERKIIKNGYVHLIPELENQSRPYNEKLEKALIEAEKAKESNVIVDTEVDPDPEVIPTVSFSAAFSDFGDFIQPVLEKMYNFFHKKPWSAVKAEARKRTIYSTKDDIIIEKNK